MADNFNTLDADNFNVLENNIKNLNNYNNEGIVFFNKLLKSEANIKRNEYGQIIYEDYQLANKISMELQEDFSYKPLSSLGTVSYLTEKDNIIDLKLNVNTQQILQRITMSFTANELNLLSRYSYNFPSEGATISFRLNLAAPEDYKDGNDATEHINNLIKVYNALVAIVTDAKGVTAAAGNAIIAIQEVRRSNGGSGNVGAPLPSNAPDSLSIPNNEATTEYRCEPAARNDYTQLVQICTDFMTLINNFQTQKDELLSNWTAGANRESAVKCFDDFISNAETYNNYLTGARDNLEIAVSNLSQL